MTFYAAEMLRIRDAVYPGEDIVHRVIAAKQAMERGFGHPLSIDTLAGTAFLSRYYFIRTFARCYGVTPHQYLTDLRMDRATGWLLQGMSVSEVCKRVGFTSPAAFSNTYRRRTGRCPGSFKKAISEKSGL